LRNGQAWRLLEAGAADVLAWDDLVDPCAVILARLERWQIVDSLIRSPLVQESLVGSSPAWLSALREIVEVAHFTDASVLITGETGTGKEQMARLLHALDRRPNKRDLIVLDCTTIVPELSGSEFFGHERGAFTGAVAARDGGVALADEGTLFLDEIGELPPDLQAQLLRVVQERTYKRVGSNTWRHARFRLVCATNRDLLQESAAGRFRHDLYYRIANWICELPPLRDRTADIIPLAYHFMHQLRPGAELPKLDDAVREYLLTRAYPGNVRDLKQLISRMIYRHVGAGPISIGDIPESERPAPGAAAQEWHDPPFERAIRHALAIGVGLKDIRRVAEDVAVRIAVGDAQGNLQRAAQTLGITDRALQLRRAAQRHATPDQEGDQLLVEVG
jgi:transcriptional regulator with GAF, ATPase, and Fis domain